MWLLCVKAATDYLPVIGGNVCPSQLHPPAKRGHFRFPKIQQQTTTKTQDGEHPIFSRGVLVHTRFTKKALLGNKRFPPVKG